MMEKGIKMHVTENEEKKRKKTTSIKEKNVRRKQNVQTQNKRSSDCERLPV